MAQPTEYRYINNTITKEYGYEILFNLNGNPQTCKIVCKPTKENRFGIYQTRTNCPRGLYSFYDATNEKEAAATVQSMLDELLTEIRQSDRKDDSISEDLKNFSIKSLEKVLA